MAAAGAEMLVAGACAAPPPDPHLPLLLPLPAGTRLVGIVFGEAARGSVEAEPLHQGGGRHSGVKQFLGQKQPIGVGAIVQPGNLGEGHADVRQRAMSHLKDQGAKCRVEGELDSPLSIRPDFELGRLWSLWDMLNFNAANFYKLTGSIHAAQAYLEASESAVQHSNPLNKFMDTSIDSHALKHKLSNEAGKLRLAADAIGAQITVMAIDDHIKALAGDKPILFGEMRDAYKDILKTLERELPIVKMFSINADESRYFDPTAPLFGKDFENKFITFGSFELEEASKCMALGRPTAAVFHMMRILEIGIKALASCLGIPDPIKPAERNWAKMLDSIMKNGIEKKWPTTADRMYGDGKLFEDLRASLDAVKNPWRNSTMHVEEKKTDQEAEHIFVAVRGFMMKLSARMDENGLPLA